jgi:hypothetical protein
VVKIMGVKEEMKKRNGERVRRGMRCGGLQGNKTIMCIEV